MTTIEAPFLEQKLDDYTDEELATYITHAPNILTVREEAIRALSPCLVAKTIIWTCSPWDEVRALEQAAAVGIRVPTVRRVVSLPHDAHAIIMDRIHGHTLEQLWPSLTLWQTLCVSWQLRRAVAAMRSVKVQTTGGIHSGKVISQWVQGRHKPVLHATPKIFTDYLNWWLVSACPSVWAPRPDLLLQPPTHHVLVHQDLVPRNIIMDSSDRLWIVDWGLSGYLPAFMEFVGMEDGPYSGDHELICSRSWSTWFARLRWRMVCIIACGWHRKYKAQCVAMANVGYLSTRFPLQQPVHSVCYSSV